MNSAVYTCLFLLSSPILTRVQTLPTGAPTSACTSLTPNHPGTSLASDLPGGFYIYTELLNGGNDGVYTVTTTYEVTLASPSERRFRGFVIQAREPGTSNLIGSFTILDLGNSELLDCANNGEATVTHSNNDDKTRISFQWTSPGTAGTVEFRYSVVTARNEDYYADLNALDYRPPCPFLPPGSGATYTFRIGTPEDDYYLQARVNPYNSEYLDVLLEGVANGWVAIGFSQNQLMEEDDVLGCRIDSGMVIAVDTWNPSPRNTDNVLDATQTDICMHSGSFINGRISCSFSRLIEGNNTGQDYPLNSSYYLFYGRRLSAQTNVSALGSHIVDGIVPVISNRTYNVINDVGDNLCPIAPGSGVNYTFEFSSPEEDYHLATRVNPYDSSYLDVYLEGNGFGWVAVGVSRDKEMQEDDVLGCRVSSGIVTAIDTWNPSPRRSANVVDTNQTDICMHSGSISNGRITCVFSRLISGSDETQDYNLNNTYYLFYGRRSSAQPDDATNLVYHSENNGDTPMISNNLTNLVTGETSGTCNISPILLIYFTLLTVAVVLIMQ